jgi:hypothetical protein
LNLPARRRVEGVLWEVRRMWKMALILVMTALAIVFAHRALEAPVVETGFGAAMEILNPALAPLAPPLMYAGIRG